MARHLVSRVPRTYSIPLVNNSGRRTGYGDRWLTHRTRDSPQGPVLGQKHVGITIACLDDDSKVLLQLRKHKIFDKVWSLSGDTHPRKYDGRAVETLSQAARRCAKEDLGITLRRWIAILSVSYSAQDPRDPRYCENELLYLLAGRYHGQPHTNRRNVYEIQSVDLKQVIEDSRVDSKKRPPARKFAPWVHAIFALRAERIKTMFQEVR